MRRLAGPWCGGGLERKKDRQLEGTGLGQPQLTGCGGKLLKLEESRARGQRAAGGSGGWAGGEVGSVVPLTLGRVDPEGLARSCPQVTRVGRLVWMERVEWQSVLRGSGEGYCPRKGYLD